jgi:hypothetical protein
MLHDTDNIGAVWTVTHLPIGTQATFQSANGKYLVSVTACVLGVIARAQAVDNKHQLFLSPTATPECHLLMIAAETGALALHDSAGGFLEVRSRCESVTG